MTNPFRTASRKTYVWLMVGVLVTQVLATIAFARQPAFGALLPLYNLLQVSVMAVFTGARLTDAGYSRWLGIIGIYAIVIIIPVMVVLAGIFVAGISPDAILAQAGTCLLAILALLLSFLAWAGSRPSVPSAEPRP